MISGVCFTIAHVELASTSKTKSFESARNSLSPRGGGGGDAPRVHVRAWTHVASTVLLVRTQTFRRPLTASAGSCAEIKESPVPAEFRGRCRKAVLGVCNQQSAEGRPVPDQRHYTAVVALSRQRTHLYVGVDCQRPRHQQQRRLPHVGSVPSHLLLHPGIDCYALPAIIVFYSHALPAIIAS